MIAGKFRAPFKIRSFGQTIAPTKDEILDTLDKFGGKEKVMLADENETCSNGAGDQSPSLPDTDSTGGDDADRPPGDGHRHHYSQSVSFSNSYCDEWERLFMWPDYMKTLRGLGLDCQLRSSRFRSVCWRLYLDVLPENADKWLTRTRHWRQQYDELKTKYITEPKAEMERSENVVVNNPLSQDEESPWNRYFQDNELRITIRQDVIRTFPELEFFHCNERIQAVMTNILFCVARDNPCLSYKQGMHELLAPIIFVLHCDHQAFQHACELESVNLFCSEDREIVRELLDPQYLEHDAFAMFSQVMETVEPWYHSREFAPPSKADVIVHAQPFMRPQDMQPSNVIVNKLTRIQDYLLKKIDLELFLHLDRLDIAPQIYGIRWLRLLFGREFPMQDLLVIWDAIFANSISFDLVDYVFVAMLLFIRDIILSSDYPECLGILMRFPPVGDVHYLLELALHLRSPEMYTRPHNYTARRYPTSRQDELYHYYNSSQSHKPAPVKRSQSVKQSKTSSAAADLANRFRAASVLSSFSTLTRRMNPSGEQVERPPADRPTTLLTPPEPAPLHKSSSEPMYLLTDTGSASHSPEEARKSNVRIASSVNLSKADSASDGAKAPAPARPVTTPGARYELKHISLEAHRQNQEAQDRKYDGDTTPESTNGRGSPKNNGEPRSKTDSGAGVRHIAYLQGRINDMESMCKYCASKMDIHIEKLQAQMVKQPCFENEDEMFLALAGIKQVRDVLKGTLRFAHNLLDNDEIAINDDHFTAELRPESRMSMSVDSQSLCSNSRRSSQEDPGTMFYVESPQDSDKSFPTNIGRVDDLQLQRQVSDDELAADLDNTIAKIMTLTRRDDEFTSSTELKETNANYKDLVE